MRKICLYIACLFALYAYSDSYWIALTDKQGSTGTLDLPEQYLSERALQHRQKFNIPVDSLDLPVSKTYTDSLTRLGCRIDFSSRWLNGVTAEINSNETVEQIKSLSFVREVQRTRITSTPAEQYSAKNKLKLSANKSAISTDQQIKQLNLHKLHESGFRGKGILIAVIDDGFKSVDQLTAFTHIAENIVHTYDYVATATTQDVFCQDKNLDCDHGTATLSTIAASQSDFLGTATEALFALYRTEDDKPENMREADALVAALEAADSIGADISSISLGYLALFDDSSTNPTYQQMDGRTMRSSIAATIAARKGMLVIVAAGNEGNDPWHYIDSPADADSIITVAAINSGGQVTPFSSYGPSADGRQKPELAALGQNAAIIRPNGSVSYADGTSFSCPILAGAAACLWQALPELNNMQIRERLLQSASKYTTPNYRIGYGIPDLWSAYQGTTSLTGIDRELPLDIIEIYDLLGNRYSDQNNLPAGIYILKTTNRTYKTYINNSHP